MPTRALVKENAKANGQPVGGQRIQLSSGDSAHAPFVWEADYAVFNGTNDPTAFWGYNYGYGAGNTGNRPLSTEPAAYWGVEGDYNNGSNHVMEMYSELFSTDGNIQWRPIFMSADRSGSGTSRTTFIKSLDFYGPNTGIQMFTAADGAAMTSDILSYKFEPNISTIYAPKTTTDTLFRIKAATSHACQILLGYSATDDVFSIFPEATTQTRLRVGSSTGMRIYSINTTGGAVAINANRNDAALTVDCAGTFDNTIGITVRPKASTGTGDLIQFNNSSGTNQSRVNVNGYYMTAKSAAPGDSELATGEAALWFDKTNGAAKLMIKAKQTDGTVVTGSVTLA